jgi:hypothetical protein
MAIRLAVVALAALVGLSAATTAEAKVRLLRLTSPVQVNGEAAITVGVSRPVSCSITVYGQNGPSRTRALRPKRSIAGQVTWVWKISAHQTPARWPIHVDCGMAGSLDTSLVVSAPTLTWPPPTLVSPVTINLPTTGPIYLNLDPSKDYVLKSTGHITGGGLSVNGGHNVVMIGGWITPTVTSSSNNEQGRGLTFYNQTGTVHVEGVYLESPGDAISIEAPQAIVQIENVRTDNVHAYCDNFSLNHPDVIQIWSGPAQLRIDRLTAQSDYQGFFWSKDPSVAGSVYPGTVVGKNINLMPSPRQVDANGHPCGADLSPLGPVTWHMSASTYFSCSSCWMLTGWYSPTYRRKLQDSIPGYDNGNGTFADLPYSLGRQAIPTRAPARELGRREGDYIEWPSIPNLTNEVWAWGLPRVGDFVPLGMAGPDYASPGYGDGRAATRR